MRKGRRDIRQFDTSDSRSGRINPTLCGSAKLRSRYTRIYLWLNRLSRLCRLLRLRPAELYSWSGLLLSESSKLNSLWSGGRRGGDGLTERRSRWKRASLDAISDNTQCLVDMLLNGGAPWLEVI